jgi:hypothetical protein
MSLRVSKSTLQSDTRDSYFLSCSKKVLKSMSFPFLKFCYDPDTCFQKRASIIIINTHSLSNNEQENTAKFTERI